MENENDENTEKLIDNTDVLIIFIITAASFIIRYWRISLPPTTVFDEVYFGNFTNYYIQSQFYYDIHPPLAKIMMYYIANLSEYDGSMSFKFNAKGYPLPDYVQLRITPATFSALVFPLIYLSMRFSHFSHISSLCSSLLALFDTSLATEGRHILTDGILHFFTILHVAVLSFTLSLNPKIRSQTRFYFWHILTGITLGCACSCKNTAWGLTVFDAFCYILQFTDIISIQNYRSKKINEKTAENQEEKSDNVKSELATFISNSNSTSPNPSNDQKLNTTVLSNSEFFHPIGNDTNSPSLIDLGTENGKSSSSLKNDNNSPSLIDLSTEKDANLSSLKNDTNSPSQIGLSIEKVENNSPSPIHLDKSSSTELFEKIYSSESNLINSGSEETIRKKLSEVNLSQSPLEIQTSIQSSVINVVNGFQSEFDDHEFIQKVGPGGGYLDFLFDVGFFGFTLAILGLSVYIASFYVHFILLPFAGKGTGFLNPDMKKQLISNKCATCKQPNVTRKPNEVQRANHDEFYDECVNSAIYGVRVRSPSLFERTFILTFRMHSGNMRIVGFHDSQSFPWNWPILSSVSTYFWGMNGREIRCIGNAIVYYLILFSLIVVSIYVLFRFFVIFISFLLKGNEYLPFYNFEKVGKFNLNKLMVKFFTFLLSFEKNLDTPYCNSKWLIALRFIVGYSVSYFPFYWIPRTLYLYHYLIPLIFGCLSFGSMVELLLPAKYRSVFVVFVCVAAAFGFWLWSPYVYGTDKHDPDMMIWTRRWIDGDEQHKKAKIENNLKKKKK